MIKILFVCHGNICRSPMAEFVMKDLVAKAGLEHLISISSCAATYEEIGNDTYPPVRRLLNEKGIPFTKREARIFTPADYEESTYIIGMDDENRRDLYRLTKGDPQKKVSLLLEWTGENRSVADPCTLMIMKQPTVMYGKAAPRFSKGSCHDFRLPGFLQRLPMQGGQVCPLVLYAELGHRHRRSDGNEISRHDG